jgi:hypothetical protein
VACWRCSGESAARNVVAAFAMDVADRSDAMVTPATHAAHSAAARAKRNTVERFIINTFLLNKRNERNGRESFEKQILPFLP